MEIGHKIRKVRELRNLTQEFVADELGMTQSAYSKIETGENDLSFKKLRQIATVFGVEPEEIYNFNEHNAFYITNNHGLAGTGTVNNQFSEELKAVYEALIKQQAEEIAYLRGVLEKVLGK